MSWRSRRESLGTCLSASYLQQCALLPSSGSWGYTLLLSASPRPGDRMCTAQFRAESRTLESDCLFESQLTTPDSVPWTL